MNVLQPGVGPIDGAAYLPSTPETVAWGLLPNAASRPVLTAASGTAVTFDTVSHEGLLADQGGDPAAFFGAAGIGRDRLLADAVGIAAALRHRPEQAGPHIVTGPVAIPGARPGDVLEVEVLALRRRAPYGVISNRHGRGALAGEYPRAEVSAGGAGGAGSAGSPGGAGSAGGASGAGTASTPVPPVCLVAHADDDGFGRLPLPGGRALRWPLAPFLGILAVASATEAPVHSVPPGAHGGNLDIKLLTEGAKLYLPVQVDNALFAAGDPHFSQGDGEVALTAFEAPLRATVRLTLRTDEPMRRMAKALAAPFAETAADQVVIGLDPDLDEALRRAARAAIAFLGERFGVPSAVALAYLSAACDFHVSQVVDLVKGVHCRIPKADLAGLVAR
ncbi:acetamidase/formamidase family protein [Catenulispora yoronensis]|uniref:Acetamidase/formamidase family protein n=1 Tax=Catenulispora yoronensis TaxID=450799 RepID=A0ABN2TIX5_9ACTN